MDEPRAISLTVKIDKIYDEDTSFFESVCKIYLNGKQTGKIILTKNNNSNDQIAASDTFETSSFLQKDSISESNSYSIYIDSSIEYGDLLEIVCFYRKKYFTKY